MGVDLGFYTQSIDGRTRVLDDNGNKIKDVSSGFAGRAPNSSRMKGRKCEVFLAFLFFFENKEKTMNYTEYLELIEKYPNVTSEGIGVNVPYTTGRARQELKESFAEFQLCLKWLDEHHISAGYSAQHWKGQVQNAYKQENPGYFHISRGVFILAALLKGIPARKIKGSRDAWIGKREEVLA
jgi:hypothetical protein